MTKPDFADVLICTVVALLLVCVGSVAAQQSSVAISPASIDTHVKAGMSYTQNFTLSNNTNERMTFRSSASDVWFDEKNQRIDRPAGTQPRSASRWMQFTPSEIVVDPHSSAVVKAVITVPQSAVGSFYAVPVFEAAPAEKPVIQKVAGSTQSTASIAVRFRAIMMLTTERGLEYNVEIMGAEISPPTASSELELSLDLRNRGNAHAGIRGAYAILDAAGKLAGRGAIDEKRLLPTQSNQIKSRWSGELKPGSYTCIVTLTYNRVGMEPVSLVQEIPFTVK